MADENTNLVIRYLRRKANPTALDPTSPTEKTEPRGGPLRQSASRGVSLRQESDQDQPKALSYSAVASVGIERKTIQDIQKPQEDEEMVEKSLLDDLESVGSTLIDFDTGPLELQKNRPKESRPSSYRQSTTSKRHPVHAANSSSHSPSPQKRLADLTAQHKDLNRRFLEAEATCREKDMKINVLTETITRLHLKDGGLVKDDSYFATNFSDIANSIVEWTMRHFKSKSKIPPKFEDLPVELRNLVMHAAPTGENPLIFKGTRLRVISSIVIENLYGRLFGGPLPGGMDVYEPIRILTPQFQGSDFQMQRWRALTNTLITQSDDYERKFGMDIARITESIGQLISALVPPESDAGLRNTELYKLVERASRVAIEVRKQLDVITLDSPTPGMLFSGKTMEDLSCENGLEELEAGRATVHIPLCPAIMRRSCDPDGSLSPAPGELVMKAKVTTILVDSS